ncbi:MAG: SMC family ATPase [Candidatus Thorarchaeota archaeon]|nr:SMC family ATPase [Candidatus Thorarchaeota archaeon]
MKLVSLTAINFKKLDVKDLEFKDGVTLIRGPNESGKSTIMEAIVYALYGAPLKPNRSANHTLMINHNSDSAFVSLIFEIAGIKYRVDRRIFRNKGNTASLVEVNPNGKEKSLETSIKGVNTTILARMGDVSYQELVSSCVVAQKDLNHLIKQSASDRKEIINVFMNLNEFNDVLNEHKAIIRDLEGTPKRHGELTIQENRLGSLREEQVQVREIENSVRELNQNIEVSTKERDSTEAQLASENANLKLLYQYDDILIEREKIESKISALNEQKGLLNESLDQLIGKEAELIQHRERMVDLQILDEVESDVSRVEEILDSLDVERARLDDIDHELELVDQRGVQLQCDADAIAPSEEEIALLNQSPPDSRYVRGAAILAGASSMLLLINLLFVVLPLVFLVYIIAWYLKTVSFKQKKADTALRYSNYQRAQTKIEENAERITDLSTKRTDVSQTIERSHSALTDLVSKISDLLDIDSHQDLLDCARNSIERFQELNTERATTTKQIASLEKDVSKRDVIEGDIEGKETEIISKQRALDHLDLPDLGTLVFSKENLENQREIVKDLTSKISTLNERIDNYSKSLDEKQEFLDTHTDIDDRVIQQEEQVQKTRHNLDLSKTIVEAVSKTAENLRERVRPSVEVNISKILPSITNGRYAAARLSDTYDVAVFCREANDFLPKDIFSGGTEDQFLLATRIAFALALLPHRKNTRPQFLFLDEPLGSSDSERRVGIMNSIRTTLRESFDQIVLVSHVPGLEEHVDHVVMMNEGIIKAT